MAERLSVCLVAGGPSGERGISLNSARSLCDHLTGDGIAIDTIVYYDALGRAYRLPKADLYSNTPSDFDFKLQAHGRVLSLDEQRHAFADGDRLVFPVIHGRFGEDGQLQRLLESCDAAFVGSGAVACARAFHKGAAAQALAAHGFATLPQLLLTRETGDLFHAVHTWMEAERLPWPLIVKPAIGGSSIGVHLFIDGAMLRDGLPPLLAEHDELLVQPRCLGREFTVVVIESLAGEPVALLPTEIEKQQAEIFTYRQKYLPSGEVAYHTPPRFAEDVIQRIRTEAEAIFAALELRDVARIDGWLLENGEIRFSDLNPISGMEQNSFLFQQAARVGFSHRGLLRHIVRTACRRTGRAFPSSSPKTSTAKQRVAVLFGGASSERHVSLMSGTNVWLKLRNSARYCPEPYLLTGDDRVWRVSYAAALNHTVEEVQAVCAAEEDPLVRARLDAYRQQARARLGIEHERAESDVIAPPSSRSLTAFLDEESHVFLALHGGIGENGVLQAELERRGSRFNGSGSAASRLCSDKAATGTALSGFLDQGITVPSKWADTTQAWCDRLEPALWVALQERLGSAIVIVKPQSDGCSTGVVPLATYDELALYLEYVRRGAEAIPDGLFLHKQGRTALPMPAVPALLFETYIATDEVRVREDGRLDWRHVNDWIEVTVGVLGRRGSMEALHPSLTVALDGVLSLEEKFMGGTGINLTPPPSPPLGRVAPEAVAACRQRIAAVANTLGLNGYARIDAFMHCTTGEINVIEVNTLPGLTASTVLFHQALAATPPIYPLELLERLIDLSST